MQRKHGRGSKNEKGGATIYKRSQPRRQPVCVSRTVYRLDSIISMMTPHLLCVPLLLSLVGSASSRADSEDMLVVSTLSDQDSTLRCTARQIPGVQYSAVRWYKAGSDSSHQRDGLLAKYLPNGTTRWYKDVTRKVELQDDSLDLVLPNVTCSDSGVYLCFLAAPVGQQNQEGKVKLTLPDCPADAIGPETPLLVIFASALLVLALLISFLSYKCLKNTVKDRIQVAKKEISLNAPLKPLEKKDLMLIYTLGPKVSKLQHICV
ncbi:CD83 antigen [Xiphophorus couchianus]|uniref:CD83 antigen n=1 Tax=Xiphophorus couchianus TaxID=32473 RepID=UPI0010170778|nr:CD83 antigen [Xiphophorus couchianus]